MDAARLADEAAQQPNAEEPAETALASETTPGAAESIPSIQTTLVTRASAAQELACKPDPSSPRRIDEIVACSRRQDVLYEWQCRNLPERLRLFRIVEEKAGQLKRILPLGRLRQFEIVSSKGRMALQIASDRKLWVCSSHPAAKDAPPQGS
jgi:hypothetical protein